MSQMPDTAKCRECGYLLRGLTVHRCPECGIPFDPADPNTFDPGESAPDPGLLFRVPLYMAVTLVNSMLAMIALPVALATLFEGEVEACMWIIAAACIGVLTLAGLLSEVRGLRNMACIANGLVIGLAAYASAVPGPWRPPSAVSLLAVCNAANILAICLVWKDRRSKQSA
jgi:rubredoxin